MKVDRNIHLDMNFGLIRYSTIIILLFTSYFSYSQEFWEALNTPPDIKIYSIAINSGNEIYIGLSYDTEGGIYKSIDTGSTWYYTGLEYSIWDIFIKEPNNIYAGSGYLYYSDNNGISWDTISEQIDPITIYVHENFILVGTWGGIYKSNDLGNSWNQVLFLENTELVNTIIQNDSTNEQFAGTSNFIGGGGVYRSDDSGNTWGFYGLENHYVSSLALNSNNDLFAGSRGHHYLYSGGVYVLPHNQQDWISLNNEELVTSIIINSEDEIYIGCSNLDSYVGGVRRSFDNGQSWEDISSGIGDKNIEDLEIGTDGFLYTSGYFTPLFRSTNSTITNLSELFVPATIITYNYPNPFTDETTILLSLPSEKRTDANVIIMDSHGNILDEYFIQNNIKRVHSIKFHPKDLSTGVYYYQVSVGDQRLYRKMMLIK